MAAPTGLPARVTPASTSAAAANTYYVDASVGSDANTATQAKSPSTPWATVQHALDSGIPIPAAGSGAPVQLYIRGTDGTTTRGFTITDTGPGSAVPAGFSAAAVYQPARTLNFPSDSPLIISNYPGERVLVGFPYLNSHGYSYVCWRGNTVAGKKGIVFDPRFPAGNTTFSGWACHGGSNLELYNCEIRNAVWNASGAGVYAGGYSLSGINEPAANVQIISCYIHHNGGQNVGSHGIYFGGTTGSQLVGATGGAIYNNLIVFNYVDNLAPHNCWQSGVVAHNICAGWGGGGASGSTATTPVTGDTNKNSSFTDGITFFSGGSGVPQSSDIAIVNNILADNNVYGLNFFDSTLTGTGNVEKNNCYFGNGTGTIRDAGGQLSRLSTLLNNNPLFASYLSTNPASDFHVQTGSPCSAAGDASYTPTFDFDGVSRTGSDVGAFEISPPTQQPGQHRMLLAVGA